MDKFLNSRLTFQGAILISGPGFETRLRSRVERYGARLLLGAGPEIKYFASFCLIWGKNEAKWGKMRQNVGTLRQTSERWGKTSERWGKTSERWCKTSERWGKTSERWQQNVGTLRENVGTLKQNVGTLRQNVPKRWNVEAKRPDTDFDLKSNFQVNWNTYFFIKNCFVYTFRFFVFG